MTASNSAMNRRDFWSAVTITLLAASAKPAAAEPIPGEKLQLTTLIGPLKSDPKDPPLPGSVWHTAQATGEGILWKFSPGALETAKFLAADMLLDGNHLIAFQLRLSEGENGPTFRVSFGGLNQCSFRVRLAIASLDLNRFVMDREGGFLQPQAGSDRVVLSKVDRLALTVLRKSSKPARWAMTDFFVSRGDIPRLARPVLPKGPLIDEMGQSTIHEWHGKTRDVATLNLRIQRQFAEARKHQWPATFSRWGGWKAKKIGDGSGYFRTHHDGNRWWLVDPDGFAYFSSGADCVSLAQCEARYDGIEAALKKAPPAIAKGGGFGGPGRKSVNYLSQNMIRALGRENWRDKWAAIAMGELKRMRFNTVGNWGDWKYASAIGFPYVRPLQFSGSKAKPVYRDFPDVFHPEFPADTAAYANQLTETALDPALIGYFLMNEPEWHTSSEFPATGMLYNSESCSTREELARFLKGRYTDSSALAAAWKMPTDFEKIALGKWTAKFTQPALDDLKDFSVLMVERYFQTLCAATRRVDPNHLILGMRWAFAPPEWAVRGMKSFDVFSTNFYGKKLPRDLTATVQRILQMPVIVGEWSFGALDVGLPTPGLAHVRTQLDRGKAYRVYLEDAAANPNCVGVHWFTLYDESAIGRFDGENFNFGFIDICSRPYEELVEAAAASHERMYLVAEGREKPFDDLPEYMPDLFI